MSKIKFKSSKPDPFQSQEKLILLLIDLTLLCLSFFVAYYLRFSQWNFQVFTSSFVVIFAGLVLTSYYIFGNYDLDEETFLQQTLKQLFAVVIALILFLFLMAVAYQEQSGILGRGVIFRTLIAFYLLTLIPRYMIWKVLSSLQQNQNWLFITDLESLNQLLKEFANSRHAKRGVFLLPFQETLDLDPKAFKLGPEQMKHWDTLPDEIQKNWSSVIVALKNEQELALEKKYGQLLIHARFNRVHTVDVVQFFESAFKKIPISILNQHWFVMNTGFVLVTNIARLRVKRLFDLVLAIMLGLVVWPVVLISALIIVLESNGPVFYRQIRHGLRNKPYFVYKLRSMRQDAEKNGAVWAQQNDHRVTNFGNFMRKTRIDELPQIWNVICGDMSFIGPRPERPEFDEKLEQEIPFYALRYLVRPGITGWAQVMYPYGASEEDAKQKLQYDLYYIKNHSFWLDFIIVLRTFRVVFFGGGR
ncbi:MAG: sugar transferase [Pseudobdellovibrionaceae bacterium]